MLRLMGAALVAAGCAWLGLRTAAELRRRVWAVRRMADGLGLLEGELELSAPPLPRLMALGAQRCQSPARELFQGCLAGLDRLDQEGFSSLWRRLSGQLPLPPEGQAVLLPLGDILGRYDVQRQREGLSAARRRLEDLAARLEDDARRQARVCQALGLSGGAFLVILLL